MQKWKQEKKKQLPVKSSQILNTLKIKIKTARVSFSESVEPKQRPDIKHFKERYKYILFSGFPIFTQILQQTIQNRRLCWCKSMELYDNILDLT